MTAGAASACPAWASLVEMRLAFALALLATLAGTARADEGSLRARADRDAAPGLVYVEALGKAGLYGVGYERAITPRLALGGVASYVRLHGQHVATAAPYLHATLLRGRRHALFGELGLVLAHSRIVSPVDGWDGMAETGSGGVAALGWERRGRRVVVRAQGSVLAGEGGATPWLGLALGWRP